MVPVEVSESWSLLDLRPWSRTRGPKVGPAIGASATAYAYVHPKEKNNRFGVVRCGGAGV